ncbi:SIR2 family protein [Flavobacterium psychrophilum]|uniref:SIR2 family protein n=1 Tax=Flavobacterium psychrophilum TaxID=96345 RepID=UPI000B8EB7FD|nr:SIR2 family protein [Flavobacterium psychrophilum]
MDEIKERVFTIIQNYLKTPPVVIWGSGATVPFGLPSMRKLNEIIKENIPEFDKNCDNLEIELGKDKYQEVMPQIRNIIWKAIAEVDKEVLQKILISNSTDFNGIKKLVEKISDAHPKVANIVTTNYDRIIENVLSFHGIPFTDGFLGKDLSLFDENLFSSKNIVNIVKVHGSLNWFDLGGDIRYLQNAIESSVPQIICPGKNKYQEAYKSPYRELIQKSDLYINSAKSFLVVGFGFNDEHLTPRIKSKIKKGTPIVVITKMISQTCLDELEVAEKYVLLEEEGENNTKITLKERNSEKQIIILEGNFWSLNNFIDII